MRVRCGQLDGSASSERVWSGLSSGRGGGIDWAAGGGKVLLPGRFAAACAECRPSCALGSGRPQVRVNRDIRAPPRPPRLFRTRGVRVGGGAACARSLRHHAQWGTQPAGPRDHS